MDLNGLGRTFGRERIERDTGAVDSRAALDRNAHGGTHCRRSRHRRPAVRPDLDSTGG